jgi:hypothetical protein
VEKKDIPDKLKKKGFSSITNLFKGIFGATSSKIVVSNFESYKFSDYQKESFEKRTENVLSGGHCITSKEQKTYFWNTLSQVELSSLKSTLVVLKR